MDIEMYRKQLQDAKVLIDNLLNDELVSSTDYAAFFNLSLRVERKLEKFEMKRMLEKKLADKKTKTKG
jgi:hypothetical protein